MRIARRTESAEHRLAIEPYPSELEEAINVAGVRLSLRPIRPTDEALQHEFLQHINDSDLYFRFFHAIKSWSHQQLARLTQIDCDREMALVALRTAATGANEIRGVARCIADPDNCDAEFAILVRSDFHRRGLGLTMIDGTRHCERSAAIQSNNPRAAHLLKKVKVSAHI